MISREIPKLFVQTTLVQPSAMCETTWTDAKVRDLFTVRTGEARDVEK